ncbi:class I SAM-dependent methyltransferase [Gemmata sp. JC673]|uniref:Class I SAM-dependent methyltransferase n=1 Tax=Gemmata algarum TaxID=2975278 RepID=A0ABU5FAW0_9BACT|nr:methyltransferase [Gemmata algarum]MDY3562979.1 class I SAM-dependent methyltransferase [Gemmata algarum]
MKHVTELFATVAHRVKPPVLIAVGPPWPVANLVKALDLPETEVTCAQLDLHQTDRVRETLAEVEAKAEVVTVADMWDLPQRFGTVIFPASSQADRELKLDIVEQAAHVLTVGGLFLTLSEYERDSQFAKLQKKIFGKCGETPASENGMAFFSTKTEESGSRRRHEVKYHAKIGAGASMEFVSRPGTFSYGRFDAGSRAMLEVAEIRPGDTVLDLGCGNGAVGCLAGGMAGPDARVTFIDSSLRAIALAELNAKANGVANARFVNATRLQGLEEDKFDVILANPPYYAKSEITRLFIEGARDLLKPGGRYYLVTKMPTAVMPLIFDTFGDCSVIENRGYAVVLSGAGEE